MGFKKTYIFVFICLVAFLLIAYFFTGLKKENDPNQEIVTEFLSYESLEKFMDIELVGWEFKLVTVSINKFVFEEDMKYAKVNYIDRTGKHDLNLYIAGIFEDNNWLFKNEFPVFSRQVNITEEYFSFTSLKKKYTFPPSTFSLDTKPGSALTFIVLTKYNKENIFDRDFCIKHDFECKYVELYNKYGYHFNDIEIENINDEKKYIIPFGLYEAF